MEKENIKGSTKQRVLQHIISNGLILNSKEKFKGLTSVQAKELLEKYGLNTLEENKESDFYKILKKITNPINLMIETALILSFLAEDYSNSIIIFVLLMVNLLVDYLQEKKANNAISELKKILSLYSYVLRDGEFIKLESKFLVPGDIVKLSIGDIVPADAKLLKSEYLEVDQSVLTGESLPVIKEVGEEVYSGSIVKAGSALVKIFATGKNTKIGKSEKMIEESERQISHFQKAIFKIGKFLITLSFTLVLLLSLKLYLRGDSFTDILKFALVLVVASVPVALPAVLSVLMAVGALTLAKKKAVVKNFAAIEELAGVSVLATDKTGTLTQNKLSLKEPIVFDPFKERDLLVFALLASEDENKNAIEQAIEHYAKQKAYDEHALGYKVIKFIPFNPKNKTTAEIVKDKAGNILKVTMGAAEVIAEKIPKDQVKKLIDTVGKLAEDGFRSLAVSLSINGGKDNLVGVLPMFDPPREDSIEAIENIKKMHIKVKMITGDNIAVARYIAKVLNIGKNIISAEKLTSIFALISKERIYQKLMSIDVFAGVRPKDKYKIIEHIQGFNHIVAMTGDGVNDAPALKRADVGIAVSGATDAARASADLVLLSTGLKVIEDAVLLARKTFAKMLSYSVFRISETIRIIFFISLSILLFNFTPLTPAMIILLALLNDVPIMMLAYDNAPLNKKPMRWKMKEVFFVASVLGVSGVISSFLFFSFLREMQFSVEIIQTMLFLKLDIAGHSTLYTTRTFDKHFWEKPLPSLKFFIPAFSSRLLGIFIAYFGIFMHPVGIKSIIYVWMYASFWFIINDFLKVWAFRMMRSFGKDKISVKMIKV